MNARGRFPQFVLSCLLATGALLEARNADACSPPPNGPLYALPSTRVSTKAVVFSADCTFRCYEEPNPTLTVTDADGATVPGTLELRGKDGSYWGVWTPTTPLTAGAEYEFEFTDPGSQWGTQPIKVTAIELDGTPPEPTAKLTSVEREVGERVCCPAFVGSCTNESCFTEQRRDVPALSLVLPEDLGAWPVEARITWTGGAVVTTTDWHILRGAYQEFAPGASKYCYRLELRNISDGKIDAFPERCELSDGLKLTERELSGTEIREEIDQCETPPKAFVEKWCAEREACATGIEPGYCIGYAELCKDVKPVPGEGGAGGASGGPAPYPIDGNDADRDEGGCSTSPARGASSGWLASSASLATLLGLAAFVFRRRRRA
jgi:MYXO-CTERM domain-containing protein